MKKNNEAIKNRIKITQDIDLFTDGLLKIEELISYVKRHKKEYNDNTMVGLTIAKNKHLSDLDILWDFFDLFSGVINSFQKLKEEKKKTFLEINSKINYPKFKKNGTIVLENSEIKLSLVDLFPLEKKTKNYEDSWEL